MVDESESQIGVILIAVIGSLALIIIAGVCIKCKRDKQKQKGVKDSDSFHMENGG